MLVQPEFATVVKVCSRLQKSGRLPRDMAGRLRGDLIWLLSSSSGHGAKRAGFGDPHSGRCGGVAVAWPSSLGSCRAVSALLHVLGQSIGCPVEAGELRLDWVVFLPDRTPPKNGTCLVLQQVLQSWKTRWQQIFAGGETLVVLVTSMRQPEDFAQADMLWFIDNQASVTVVVKGCSSKGDVMRCP